MRILEKITLVIYSTLMLIAGILACLLIFGWVDYNMISNIIYSMLIGEVSSNVLLVVNIIFILLSIKCIFFDSKSKEEIKSRQGVLLQNDNGQLMISKETLENLVNTVAKDFDSAEEISTKVELDKDNNVRVYVNLIVRPNTVIKELSTNLQNRIKEAIKNASDLEVKEVNIKVKNIAPKIEMEND